MGRIPDLLPERNATELAVGFRGDHIAVGNRQTNPVLDFRQRRGLAASLRDRSSIDLPQPGGKIWSHEFLSHRDITLDFILLSMDRFVKLWEVISGQALQRRHGGFGLGVDGGDPGTDDVAPRQDELQILLDRGHELQTFVVQEKQVAKAQVAAPDSVLDRLSWLRV